ncbi:hypothetical protein DH2020_040979 [Rehmannia glutinosa]|uniref:ACB domain-containing protein n=1 Tax=Rehmannia glutinosa TaxID=99300 RepID=A0ABR0UTG6_REHGL
MDAVDILMLCVVGFSVLVFLIVQNLDSVQENRKIESKIRNGPYFFQSSRAICDQEEEKSVASDQSFKRAVFEEIIEEEAEIQENASSDNFCSGLFNVSEKTGENEIIDDWEGIERSELEKKFGEAVVFMSYKRNADKIDGDLKLELYALQKLVLEGVCQHGSQPMALNFSARAQWNAWQKLGNMSRDKAMEKYVNILVNAIPGWKSKYGVEAEIQIV